ncbi:MAG TPA: PepSY-associated TM helix domain-containing protein [Bryobacteraceae bacterium]|jgi:uncharacterized iron-regulated membrane protein|nr:PepSY-associated TM helix domain-containing protein [Bryobacteraceae bacterium]
MNFIRRFFERPQQMWIRRANFQIHLWVGIVLALYVMVIGVSGSILVLRIELGALSGANPWESRRAPEPRVDITAVVRNLTSHYPGFRIASVIAPGKTEPTYIARLWGRGQIRVGVDAGTGEVLGEIKRGPSWLDTVEKLHVSLFASRNGRILNGVGAAFLLAMCITGLINWWPGVRNWKRALKVDFGRSWRRINFDLHSAAGFWTLAIISFWAVSGVYFAWPREIFALVNRISPIVNSKPPVVEVPARNEVSDPDLAGLIKHAYALDPGTTFAGVEFPFNRRAPITILMRRGNGLSREYEDTLYFDPYTGGYLTTWKYGVDQSFGDWFIWSQVPLHFGVYWGLGVKIIWALLGLAVPTLALTGLLMYWNRTLRKKWKRLRAEPQFPPE